MRPITLSLYDVDDQPLRTVAAISVPWRLVKLALSMLNTEYVLPDTEYLISALVGEVFAGQVTPQELAEGATTAELLTVARMIAARYGRMAGLTPVQVEQMLVGIGWTLDAIDRTDAESLKQFVAGLVQRAGERTPSPNPFPEAEKGGKKRGNVRYADEVDWL